MVSYRLTIDLNLTGEAAKVPAVDTLKRWLTEGKIDMIESAPSRSSSYGWPGAAVQTTANLRKPGPRWRVKRDPPGSTTFKTVAAVLFPGKDALKLNMTEVNDVAHLVKHHTRKHEFFVTENLKVFITDGARERLKSSLGIITVTPIEVVSMLSKLNEWKQ